MKKIISLLVIVAMLASIAAVNVSAAGQIYMQDSFDELNFDKWRADVSAFTVTDGWLTGDHTAVVHQTMYDDYAEENNLPSMTWSECYVSVDIRFEDYSVADWDDYMAALWWKDYQLAPGEEWYEGFDYTKGAIYELKVHTETNRVALWANYDELEEETTAATGTETAAETEAVVEEEDKPLMEAVFPEGTFAANFIDPPIVTLGMEVTSTGISAFLNGKHLFTWNSPTALGQNEPSPILLVNEGLMVGFDNFMVTSLDWDGVPAKDAPTPGTTAAGGEQGGNDPAPTPDPAPVTRVDYVTDKVIVTDTDDSGNIVTREEIVTKEVVVTVPTADTNPGAIAGGTSTSTGDMAVIVIAVMIVSFGAAIVVKKVSIK